jgi:PAS domain S-box-containing protein
MLEIIGSPDEKELKIINCFEYESFREIGLSDALLKSVETQELIFNETSFKSKSGKRVDYRYYITPIINHKSNVSGLIINMEDVTLSKEFERSKKKSELKYRILVENSLQAMLVVRGTKMIFANSRMEELSQYTFHELAVAEDWLRMIIHQDDYEQVKSNIRDALDKKKVPARSEYRYIRKDGAVRWMESLGSIVNYDDQPAILVVAIDITERKVAETILLESESQLRKANAMKDKFFSIIAHDLKNPFNAILGFSNLLFEAYDNFSDQQRKAFIKNICDASDSTFKLLQNLLEWSRTQTGKIDFHPEIINVAAIVQENLTVLKSAADRKKIELVTNIPEQTMAYADGNMAKAIVRNLISNAIKFTKSGGKIEIAAVNSGDEITTTVADNGVGIKPDDQNRLFRIDDHFRTAGTDHEEGSGLGLILCKEFAEKNGGKIWVESTPGKGSKFIFTLPAAAKK